VPKVVLRPKAEDDLANLLIYIAKRSGSPERAINYIRRIRARCEMLLTFPNGGSRRDDLRPGIMIAGFERRVVIAYKALPSGDIEIGRIFYGGRNYEALLSTDENG
jgi:toxin ParE1/3/4